MKSKTFDRFAGWCAILTGIAAFLYAVAFIVVARSDPALGGLLSALFLTLIGLFSSAVMIALYNRLRETDQSFALWALLLGVVAALASAAHGGYDLANAIHPSSVVVVSAAADVPSQIDPRGLLTFGVAGIALLVVAWLIRCGGALPRGLGSLGYLSSLLLIILYLARLIVLSPASLVILVPAVVNGFVVTPIWYVWLGLALLRRPATDLA